MASNESGNSFKYFLIGGLIGSLVSILFAPRSGKETREFLEQKAKDGTETITSEFRKGRDYLTNRREDLQSQARDLLDKAKNITLEEKEIIASAIDAGRRTYREEREKRRD